MMSRVHINIKRFAYDSSSSRNRRLSGVTRCPLIWECPLISQKMRRTSFSNNFSWDFTRFVNLHFPFDFFPKLYILFAAVLSDKKTHIFRYFLKKRKEFSFSFTITQKHIKIIKPCNLSLSHFCLVFACS